MLTENDTSHTILAIKATILCSKGSIKISVLNK